MPFSDTAFYFCVKYFKNDNDKQKNICYNTSSKKSDKKEVIGID